MTQRRLAWLLVPTLCGGCALLALAPDRSLAAEPETAGAASGRYRVAGETVDKATGARREISGTITLQHRGDEYSATFELRTVLPGAHATPAQAQVLGTGSGRVEGRTLRGTADTQVLSSAVPGVDAGFVGMPRQVSARIRSSSVAEVAADGTITIEIDNEPAKGDAYSPTHTKLKGKREQPRQPD